MNDRRRKHKVELPPWPQCLPVGCAKSRVHSTTQMPPETRALVALIERFRPERIASVHAHRIVGQPGNDPGIFVDPAKDAAGHAGDALAQAMVQRGQQQLELKRYLVWKAEKIHSSAMSVVPSVLPRMPKGRKDIRLGIGRPRQHHRLGRGSQL